MHTVSGAPDAQRAVGRARDHVGVVAEEGAAVHLVRVAPEHHPGGGRPRGVNRDVPDGRGLVVAGDEQRAARGAKAQRANLMTILVRMAAKWGKKI